MCSRKTAVLVALLTSSSTGSAVAGDLLQATMRGLSPKQVVFRIVGGRKADIRERPWQVFLDIPVVQSDGRRGTANCGGSLIDREWVLTAAHCMAPRDPNAGVVVTEKPSHLDDPNQTLRRFSVHTVFVHPQYNAATSENDIALLKLPEKASATPIKLASEEDTKLVEPERMATVAGFGRTHSTVELNGKTVDANTKQPVDDSELNPNDLLEVDLPIVETGACKTANRSADKVIDTRTVCAGFPEGGKDSCQGDSGGPLITKADDKNFVQIGLVSWGLGCAAKGLPGVYTRISAFKSFINTTTRLSLVGPKPKVVAQVTPPQADPPTPVATLEPAREPPAPEPESAPPPPPPPALVASTDDNPAHVSVNFVDAGTALQVGREAILSVVSGKPGFLVILDLRTDGSLQQIYPNEQSLRSPTGAIASVRPIRPSHVIMIPDPRNPYDNFRNSVRGPLGRGVIAAILSPAPLKAAPTAAGSKTFSTAQESAAFIQQITDELVAKTRSNLATQGHAGYSIAFLPYEVVK